MVSPRLLCALFAIGSGCAPALPDEGQVRLDTWIQGEQSDVDVLFVVDDSSTMEGAQDTLTAALDAFVAPLAEERTAFRLGVTTTSLDPEPVGLLGMPPFLTRDDPDWADSLVARVAVGTAGADKEKGLGAARAVVRDAGFVRPEGTLLAVFVSDEEDCTDDGALDGDPAVACYTDADRLTPVDEVVRELRTLVGGDAVTLGAIVGFENGGCGVYRGNRYLQSVAYTGGIAADICEDPRYALGELGAIATGLRRTFLLGRAAQPESLEVYVDGESVPVDPLDGYGYDPDTWFVSLHGAAVPARGAEIRVSYTVDASKTAPSLPSEGS